MAKKLTVKTRYVNRDLCYEPGVIEVDDARAAMLMADAPGVFEEYIEPEPEKPSRGKAVKNAPADKMVWKPVDDK